MVVKEEEPIVEVVAVEEPMIVLDRDVVAAYRPIAIPSQKPKQREVFYEGQDPYTSFIRRSEHEHLPAESEYAARTNVVDFESDIFEDIDIGSLIS